MSEIFSDLKKYKLINKVINNLSDINHKRLIEYIIENINENIKRKEDDKKNTTSINLSKTNISNKELNKIDIFVDKLIGLQNLEKK
jgi:fructose-1-phosphate kinase PfkB-like protein